jgi:hypothetical protein
MQEEQVLLRPRAPWSGPKLEQAGAGGGGVRERQLRLHLDRGHAASSIQAPIRVSSLPRAVASRKAPVLAVAALLAPALAGCLDPYRAHVDEAVLAHATLSWARSDHPQKDGGLFGVKTERVDYVHSGSGPPFPAVLVVFSLRAVSRPPTEELLRIVHLAVDNETHNKGIRIDQRQSSSGHRALAGGIQTEFFTEEGTSTAGNDLFAVNTKVRIVGEVGYDGRSSTNIVAVGIAQVESSRSCPLGINCGTTHDEVSWIELVGDAQGSVGGATSQFGLIDHLVTHG